MQSFKIIQIKGTKLIVNASLKNGGNISFPTFSKGIALPQARQYADALKQCAMFVESHIGRGGGHGQDTPWVTFPNADLLSIRHKLLFMTDDSFFVIARRARLAWNLFSGVSLSVEEWDIEPETLDRSYVPSRTINVGPAAARQAAHTINMVVDKCQRWFTPET